MIFTLCPLFDSLIWFQLWKPAQDFKQNFICFAKIKTHFLVQYGSNKSLPPREIQSFSDRLIMFGEPLIWPKLRPKMKESHSNKVKWHIESNLNFKLIFLYNFWPVWWISTKFEILAILMWNHLKPIPKIRFWPNLAKMMA